MFSWEWVDGFWATKSEDVGLIVRAVSFQDFQVPTYVILIHQRHRRTDRHTDVRHAISIPGYKYTSALVHGLKTSKT